MNIKMIETFPFRGDLQALHEHHITMLTDVFSTSGEWYPCWIFQSRDSDGEAAAVGTNWQSAQECYEIVAHFNRSLQAKGHESKAYTVSLRCDIRKPDGDEEPSIMVVSHSRDGQRLVTRFGIMAAHGKHPAKLMERDDWGSADHYDIGREGYWLLQNLYAGDIKLMTPDEQQRAGDELGEASVAIHEIEGKTILDHCLEGFDLANQARDALGIPGPRFPMDRLAITVIVQDAQTNSAAVLTSLTHDEALQQFQKLAKQKPEATGVIH